MQRRPLRRPMQRATTRNQPRRGRRRHILQRQHDRPVELAPRLIPSGWRVDQGARLRCSPSMPPRLPAWLASGAPPSLRALPGCASMNEDFDNWVLLPVRRDVAARSGSWAGWHGVRGDYPGLLRPRFCPQDGRGSDDQGPLESSGRGLLMVLWAGNSFLPAQINRQQLQLTRRRPSEFDRAR